MLKPLFTTAAGGALLLASSDLYFQPSEGAELNRSFTLDLEGGIDDAEISAMGQVQSLADMELEVDSGETALSWEVIDTFEKVERGRALVFDRLFGEFLVDGEPSDDDGDGPEMPESVRFEWDEESESYTVTVTEEGASEETEAAAQALLPDMDYTFLLPAGEVEEGASWTVEADAQRLAEMLFPGLDLEQMIELGGELDDDVEPEQLEQFLEAWSDFDAIEVTLTYAGTTTDDDVECDAIDIEFEFDDSIDVGDLIMEAMEEEEGGPSDLDLSLTYDVEGTGRMLWHKGEHRLHSMLAELEVGIEVEGSATIGDEDFQIPLEGFATGSATVVASQRVE